MKLLQLVQDYAQREAKKTRCNDIFDLITGENLERVLPEIRDTVPEVTRTVPANTDSKYKAFDHEVYATSRTATTQRATHCQYQNDDDARRQLQGGSRFLFYR